MKIGVVDLFCGIGGLTFGLQKAGLDVIAGIDIDSTCEYAYTHNNSSIFIEKNVSDIKAKDVKNLLRAYDIKVLVGCAPCQPFSSHQKDKKKREKHKDWNLLNEYGRLISEVKPQIVSMENVPELQKEKVFTDFLTTLKELKYSISYQVVDASNYGVPQRRKRLILLASRLGKIQLIPPTHLENKVSVRDAIANLPPIEAGCPCPSDRLHYARKLSENNLRRIQASVPGGTWRDWPEDLRLPCHKQKTGESYASVYGRMRWDEVSPTITTQFTGYGTGRFGHPEQDRALTLREGAILQSFPANYEFISDDDEFSGQAIAKHIGNAVPPRLGEIIGKSIIIHVTEYEGRKRKKAIQKHEERI